MNSEINEAKKVAVKRVPRKPKKPKSIPKIKIVKAEKDLTNKISKKRIDENLIRDEREEKRIKKQENDVMESIKKKIPEIDEMDLKILSRYVEIKTDPSVYLKNGCIEELKKVEPAIPFH